MGERRERFDRGASGGQGFGEMMRPPLMLLLSVVLPVAAADDLPLPRVELLAPSRSFPYALEAADLDGDGDLDLVNLPDGSAATNDPQIYWIENLGGREFAPLRLMQVVPRTGDQLLKHAAVIDLTGDAKPEIFVSRSTGWQPGSAHEPLALTPGLAQSGPAPANGSLLAPASPAGSDSWAAVDLDADGQAELIRMETDGSPNATTATLRIYERQADQSFAESAVVETEFHGFPLKYEAVDLDGDGDLELSMSLDSSQQVLERTGPRAFAAAPLAIDAGESYPGESRWVDVDGDGLPELKWSRGNWAENHGGLDFESKEGWEGSGLFQSSLIQEVEPRAGQPALMHAVLAVEQGSTYEWVKIPFNTAEPVSRQMLPLTWGNMPTLLKMADLDGDGWQDLVFRYETPLYSQEPGYLLAVAWGAATDLPVTMQILNVGPGKGYRVITGDFNRDKATDLIAGPDVLGHYSMRFNAGRAPATAPAGTGEWLSLEGLEIPGTTLEIIGAARIDRDKVLDLVCKYSLKPGPSLDPLHAIVVVRGRKDGSFYKPEPLAAGMFSSLDFTAEGSQLLDWDRDGDLDLVGGGFWLRNEKGTFVPWTTTFLVWLGSIPGPRESTLPFGETVTGDLDGDKFPDIISLAYGHAETTQGPGLDSGLPEKILIAFNNGQGHTEDWLELPMHLAQWDYFTNEPLLGTVVMTDLNGDKLPDLWIRELKGIDAMANPVAVDHWLENPGHGSRNVAEWVSRPLPNTVTPGLSLADFDADRKLEWVSPTGFLKPAKQGPVLSEAHDFSGGLALGSTGMRAGVDYDADGDVDFLIGGEDEPLLVLHNLSADGLKKRGVMKVKGVKWSEAVR